MKILLFTDNHFSTTSSIIRKRGKKFSLRLENQIKCLNWVNTLAIQKECDAMICLGDFFNTADLSSEELSALAEIQWNTLPKVFLVGNHEAGCSDLSFNSTNALIEIGEIIDKPTLKSIYGCDLIFLPYIVESDRKSLKEYIDSLYSGVFTTQEVKNTIILSHNDLKGIHYGHIISTTGVDINEIEKYCNLFINGHLHNQTQVNEKILNLGNLTGQNFLEDGTKYSHCVGILDTDTLKVELINNPYAFCFYRFEINTLEDISENSKYFNEYAVMTIKVKEELVEELKKALTNVCEYRLLVQHPIVKIETNGETIDETKVNAIQQFATYVLDRVENSQALLDELNLLQLE